MTSKNIDILIVDDEKDIRLLIQGILDDEGFSSRQAGNAEQAREQILKKVPDLIILDIWLQDSDMDGLEILKDVKSKNPYLPVIMISGHGTIETAVSAIKQGAYDFIEKPFKSDRLLMMIARALETASLKKENAALKARIDISAEFIGQSQSILHVKTMMQKIAPTNSRVLITGEAGTGKEVVAREIHRLSERKNMPFIALNCAVMHPERLEEELFGVEKSGSVQQGLLEQANGGTLLLDEVADMPLETQGKILRVLQDNQITHLGNQTPIHIDVRILASSNRNLSEAIEKGDFREDLFYRLNVVPLSMPPLRNRRGDVALLLDYYIDQYAKSSGVSPLKLSDRALRVLDDYFWPGNVRQLKNMAEWVMIMASASDDKNVIEEDDLPPEIIGMKKNTNKEALTADYTELALREAREMFEKNYLQAQMMRFQGSIKKTAEFVGMERSALHRKLKSLDISLADKQDDLNQGEDESSSALIKADENRKTA